MDQFSIQPGEPYPWTIQQAVVHADVLIALIGPHWADITGPQGRRRLDDDNDLLRREITAALDRGTLVLPVLLPGASLPEISSLPAELQGLLELQFLELSAKHWTADVAELKSYLERYYSEVTKETTRSPRSTRVRAPSRLASPTSRSL